MSGSKKYINHPLLKENVVEERLYQLSVASKCIEKRTLVVLPTSLGKTVVALLVIVAVIEKSPGKVLILAPTRPLVDQHFEFFNRAMNIDSEKIVALSGQTVPEKRTGLWESSDIIIATPQVIENDILTKRIDLSDVSCIVFDEAHRAVGNYAYTYISEKYYEQRKNPHVLAITASPGSNDEKISDVCEALNIESIIIKTENDPDVRPYVHKKEIDTISVTLPQELSEIRDTLKKIYDNRMVALTDAGFHSNYKYASRTELLKFQRTLSAEIRSGVADPASFKAISVLAEILKTDHAISLVETQGAKPLLSYLKKLDHEAGLSSSSKASKRLATDLYFRQAIRLSESCDVEHPKFSKVEELVENQLSENPGSKIIVFTNYRDTAKTVFEYLSDKKTIRPIRFVGQSSKKGDKGLSQKEQSEILNDFRSGVYNTLIATSVAEEGLDIPSTDMVIFFEPVPSEIRSIQRMGRTGRFQTGRVVVLITKDTRDEAFYWSGRNKEKRMIKTMKSLQNETSSINDFNGFDTNGFGANNSNNVFDEKQKTFSNYYSDELDESDENANEINFKSARENSEEISDKIRIYADIREAKSGVLRELESFGADLFIQTLEVGDYVLSDNIAVERKTVIDFLDSLLDKKRNLFDQLINLSKNYKSPVLVIEGEDDLYSMRQIDPKAIQGALLTVKIDMNVSVIYTKNEKETAQVMFMVAEREQKERKVNVNPHGKKVAKTTFESQEYVLSSIPGVGVHAAKLLLNHFGTPENVFNATEEELMQVKGIGKKTASRIRNIIASPYKGQL